MSPWRVRQSAIAALEQRVLVLSPPSESLPTHALLPVRAGTVPHSGHVPLTLAVRS
jgi:hypothetical protein